jgi:hypothetical protein
MSTPPPVALLNEYRARKEAAVRGAQGPADLNPLLVAGGEHGIAAGELNQPRRELVVAVLGAITQRVGPVTWVALCSDCLIAEDAGVSPTERRKAGDPSVGDALVVSVYELDGDVSAVSWRYGYDDWGMLIGHGDPEPRTAGFGELTTWILDALAH